MKTSKFMAAASVLALGLTFAVQATAEEKAPAAKETKVKCAGNVEAGKNDCKTAAHSCAGKSKAGDKDAWKFVGSEKECTDAKGTVVKS